MNDPEPNGPLVHGGDLKAARARHPDRSDWLDLSTGINPWPYPLPPLPLDVWARLPDADLIEALETAAAAFYGAPAGCVLAVPGTQAALQALPSLSSLRATCRVAVVDFTYQEHMRCWARAGHRVTVAATLAEAAAEADIVVVVNPNNPDGRRTAPSDLLAARDRLARRGGWLIVDEAFGEVAPDLNVAGAAAEGGLAVLRSFGKFFGLAGIRLGFVLGDAALRAALADALGPWAVSGPAAEIGRRAFADRAWQAGTRRRLGEAAARLREILASCGLEIVGATDLFVLAETAQAPALHERLLASGIMVRRFPERPRWLRFGLPADAVAEGRLRACLGAS